MGSDSRHPQPTRTELYTDLFETLAMYRNAEHARYMAEALVRKNSSGDQLVALVDDGERAVFYNPSGRTLKGYAFGKHGIQETDVDTLWRLLSDAASWVDAHQDDLDWTHPHFCWVLDVDENDEWWYPMDQ